MCDQTKHELELATGSALCTHGALAVVALPTVNHCRSGTATTVQNSTGTGSGRDSLGQWTVAEWQCQSVAVALTGRTLSQWHCGLAAAVTGSGSHGATQAGGTGSPAGWPATGSRRRRRSRPSHTIRATGLALKLAVVATSHRHSSTSGSRLLPNCTKKYKK